MESRFLKKHSKVNEQLLAVFNSGGFEREKSSDVLFIWENSRIHKRVRHFYSWSRVPLGERMSSTML